MVLPVIFETFYSYRNFVFSTHGAEATYSCLCTQTQHMCSVTINIILYEHMYVNMRIAFFAKEAKEVKTMDEKRMRSS